MLVDGAIKSFLHMFKINIHVKTVNIFPLAEHTRKFVRRMLSVRWNRFLVCSVCDKIVSTYAQPWACYNFLKLLKNTKLKCKFWPKIIENLKNRLGTHLIRSKWKFEIFLNIAYQKNWVPRMLSHRENVRTWKFWQKSKVKIKFFFENWPRAYKVLI